MLLTWLTFASSLISALFPLPSNAQNSSQWPIHDTGLTNRLQWDHYSLILDGQRTFVWSGEFHYWRLPVPEVWRDILEKVKAAGFNAISIYSHWAYHTPNNETVDFETGARNIEPLLDLAKELGLMVNMRGGPYVNAETNAGGFALWTTTGAYGTLRNSDPRYEAAWTPFWSRISETTEKHQFTNGGPIVLTQIENEICCQRTSSGEIDHNIADYMVALSDDVREHGVVIPTMTNAPNMDSKSWSSDYLPGPGTQDMYALDSYPSCWSCNLDECAGSSFSSTNYSAHFDVVSPTQPSFIAEFQGGSYNPWGGPQGGCPANHGPPFVSVFYRHLAAERITLINLYMLYGGTNWGSLATTVVATSYDYSAPIQETRQIAEKYSETKLLGLFYRAAKDLVKTDRTEWTDAISTTPGVGATTLTNPDTQARFYVTRQSDLRSNATVDFRLDVQTKTAGNLTIPAYGNSIRLAGEQSKILVTDFTFGNNTLVYSTSEVLTHSIVDGQSVLVLWLPDGESGEFSILGGSKKREIVSGTGGGFHTAGNNLVLSYKQQKTQSVLQFDNFRVVLLPSSLAYRLWAPTLSNDFIIAPEHVLLVTGPYLVRSAEVSGSEVRITGDIDGTTNLEVFAPSSAQSIVWNGEIVETTKTSYGTLKATLSKDYDVTALEKSLGELSGWKYSNALPEADAAYNDSNWVVADHTNTPNPTKPDTVPVLYSDDYGYHHGIQIYRGHFTGNATGAELHLQGGNAFGWSAWVNGDYIGSFPGSASASMGNMTISFANTSLGEDNVLTVVMDHSGHDQRADALLPRGILYATLDGGNFTEWRLAGNAGGVHPADPVRGHLNEGGLHAERLGWHLPGFDDSDWTEGSPSDGTVKNGTMAFFRTKANVNLPEGYDASIAFLLSSPTGSVLRAQLYVNGYQYGKYVPQIGHQISFPVPPGILNLRGSNTIGLNLWSQSAKGANVDVKWQVLGVYKSAFDSGAIDAGYLQPGWTDERLQYA